MAAVLFSADSPQALYKPFSASAVRRAERCARLRTVRPRARLTHVLFCGCNIQLARKRISQKTGEILGIPRRVEARIETTVAKVKGSYNALTHVGALTTFRADRPPPARPFRCYRRVSGVRATQFHRKPTLHFQDLLLFVPVLLFSVIAHEYCAWLRGLETGAQSTTALMLGRLHVEPGLKHIRSDS